MGKRGTMTPIGIQIKYAANNAGISLKELARRLGKNNQTISGYIYGRIVPNANVLQEIANICKCDIVIKGG